MTIFDIRHTFLVSVSISVASAWFIHGWPLTHSLPSYFQFACRFSILSIKYHFLYISVIFGHRGQGKWSRSDSTSKGTKKKNDNGKLFRAGFENVKSTSWMALSVCLILSNQSVWFNLIKSNLHSYPFLPTYLHTRMVARTHIHMLILLYTCISQS